MNPVERRTFMRRVYKAKGLELLGGKCSKCGYDKCSRALEFHHKDPSTKKNGLAEYSNTSWPSYKEELDKCIILCANCHAEEHSI